MISTKNLAALPPIEILKKRTQSLAMLDAIIRRQCRYYSFQSQWAEGEQMASMRNGEGDGWYCIFGLRGALLKGFDHECEMWSLTDPKVWPGVLDGVPEKFRPFLAEPAFSMKGTTFCIWRSTEDTQWNAGEIFYPDGDDPDGSKWMLSILDGNPRTYTAWAEIYYECSLALSAVQQIYGFVPLIPKLAQELNATVQFECVLSDAVEIGYPSGRT